MAQNPDIDMAVSEIVNDAICVGDENDIVKIDLDDVKMPKKVKDKIEEEFNLALQMLMFNSQGHNLFYRWYVDGRLFFHAIIDDKDTTDGLKEIRYIDPRKIRKVREVKQKRIENNLGQVGVTDSSYQEIANEYYVFNDNGFGPMGASNNNVNNPMPSGGLKIALDSIIHVTSGITDPAGTTVLSFLHKAIRPLNNLKTLEDAAIIYRLVRAPERRVWKIDVGNLPKIKAEQYLRDTMVKYKNKLMFDQSTGELNSTNKFINLQEDIWLPVRGDARGSSVETLPSGELTGVLDDVLYFQKKLYNSLNVPISRLSSDNPFSTGHATEISREEVKFAKFIFRLRQRFSELFTKILERQLILKNIITYDDWKEIYPAIKYKYTEDNQFAELRDLDLAQNKLNVLAMIDPYVGKYYSAEWVRKNILNQTDEDIETIDEEIKIESDNPQFHPELLAPQLGDNGEPLDGPGNGSFNPNINPNLPGGTPTSVNTDQTNGSAMNPGGQPSSGGTFNTTK